MADESAQKPKIIIDEDWKSQVEREKEALQHSQEQKQEQPHAPASQGELPPASFMTLVTSLASQAIVFLGQIPNPLTGQPEVRLEEARHVIDLLEVLQQKTKGNLTADESRVLDGLLHELRMGFVAASQPPIAGEAAVAE